MARCDLRHLKVHLAQHDIFWIYKTINITDLEFLKSGNSSEKLALF